MKRKKVVEIIERYIADLEAGNQRGWWDADHKPTEAERKGRVAMLGKLIEEIRGDED